MVSKELVGSRIRQIRLAQRKTLKDVEARSGFSSTHISEIERGRTSPTIGALIRIAHALDKDPSYFIEERELEEVCITSPENRPGGPGLDLKAVGHGDGEVRVESLTRGVLGGRLLAFDLNLDPGTEVAPQKLPENGDICLVCVGGEGTVLLDGKPVPFTQGSSLHFCVDDAALSIRAGEQQPCRVIIFVDPKEAIA